MDATPSSSASEINGLRALVTTVEDGMCALHTLRMPPERDDYTTDAEHEAAYDEWYTRTHFWHATVKNVP